MLHQQIETSIESLSHDGRGIAIVQGKTTFVSGAIPTEKVIAKITKKHSRYLEAQTTDVLVAATERATPPCPHFGICGGCSMQHIENQAQFAFKQKILLEQLKHFGKVVPETVLPPITGNSLGYRRKARLGVRYVKKKEKMLVGFREKFSNYLAEIESCVVLHPSVGMRLMQLREVIQSLTQFEHIPQVEVAVSDNVTALIFRHLTDLPADDVEKLIQFGKMYDFHIYLQPNSPQKIHKIWPQNGNDYLSYFLPDYQLEMQFHPLDFTQVNAEINRMMIKQALDLLKPESTDTILDLFCGLGNFTLPLARSAQHVIGIEGSKEMVERATWNAKLNHITNTEFFAANLMEPLTTANWLNKQYDKVLLDPPRTGAKEIIAFMPNLAAKRIVYVSCNPATLARDAGDLVHNHQYKLKQVGIINMFPHTSHIEAIAVFEKK